MNSENPLRGWEYAYPGLSHSSTELLRCVGHSINSVNFAVRRDGEGSPCCLLKVVPAENGRLLAEKYRRVREYLSDREDIVFPVVLKSGETAVSSGDDLCFLFPFITAGGDIPGGKMAEAAASVLGGLNRALVDMPPADVFTRSSVYRILSENELARAVSSFNGGDTFEKQVVAEQDFLGEIIRLLDGHTMNRPQTVQHMDLHRDNVIVDREECVHVVDLESFVSVPEHQSAGFSADRFSCNDEQFALFHDAYCRAYGTERLTLVEMRLGCMAEAMQRISFIVREDFEDGRRAWVGEFPKHVRILRSHADRI